MPNANVWAAVGGVVIGVFTAAGLLIVEHIRQERRRQAMAHDLVQLNNQVQGLVSQMESLKLQKSERLQIRKKPKRTGSTYNITKNDDYGSTVDSCSDLDEFFDLSDDEEDLSKASTITPMDTIFHDIDTHLENREQLEYVLETLEALRNEYPDNLEVLWRIGKAHHRLSANKRSVDEKMHHFNKGIQACEEALNIDNESGDGHKWYAIIVGSRAGHQSLKDKLRDSMEFKKHIDIALTLKPDDATCYYLLGRYNYEIASLRWYERKAAEALFEKLPNCSHEQALKHLLKAHELGPSDWKLNKLSIGKCHIALGDYQQAIEWLRQANDIVSDVEEEEGIDDEVKGLLDKYNGYK